jgi:ribonuclease HII
MTKPRPPLPRQLPLADLRARYVERGRALPAAIEAALAADRRSGAKAILAAVERRRRANRAEGQRLRMMLRYETALWTTGVSHIAGVDEAGMSPLAGPVAAAAVIFASGTRIPGVDDSKRLTAEVREELAPVIRERALAWAVAYAEVDEIDCINIYWAGLAAMRRAIEALAPAAEHLLIDARKLRDVALPQQAIIKGDTKSLSIAAASILAKTARDARMRGFDDLYPGYGFGQHKGYPVRAHFRALRKLGACPIHRRSFAVVRQVLGLPPLPPWPARSGIPPELSGEAAALAAAASSMEATAGDLLEEPQGSHT